MTGSVNAFTSDEFIVSEAEMARRVIEPDDFVADTAAFVDYRLEGSAGKASYSFIGPGVSENADQVVNLTEPHGFCIGGAGMPSGAVNNQHMHYTAEVFICTHGIWQMRIGQYGEHRFDIAANTVFSVPPWIFRGFQNVGGADSWLFAVLGGDETGGLLWAPQVLEASEATGLYLSEDHVVLDERAGDAIVNTTRPVEQSRLDELDHYSDEEIKALIVAPDRLRWSRAALLSSVVPGHACAIAQVIGFGFSEDRHQRPPIWTPHGFSLQWLRLQPGASSGLHRIDRSQVVLLVQGNCAISYNRDEHRNRRRVAQGSVVSVPAGCWREFSNPSAEPATCVIVCGGDERVRLQWDPAVVADAHDAGWARDANGYLAPVDLLRRSSV